MINLSHVIRHQLHGFDLRSGAPPSLFILNTLYGIHYADIANIVKRTPHMITYYKNGHTPIPKDVHGKLMEMLISARHNARTMRKEMKDGKDLVTALIHLTTHVLDNYEELHRIQEDVS